MLHKKQSKVLKLDWRFTLSYISIVDNHNLSNRKSIKQGNLPKQGKFIHPLIKINILYLCTPRYLFAIKDHPNMFILLDKTPFL